MTSGTSGSTGGGKTGIVILGTIHGFHDENAEYTRQVLRDIIVELKPAAILAELPPTISEKATVEDGRVARWLVEKTDSSLNAESWSENAAADLLSVPVVPYDREWRNEF